MFRGAKLNLCNKDLMTLFYSLQLWFYSFDICNPNDDFISINETRKRCCLFFKTCNNQKDICLVFAEILVRIYLNLTKIFMKFSLKNITIFITWNLLTMNVLATYLA